jgi:hypothetical protein
MNPATLILSALLATGDAGQSGLSKTISDARSILNGSPSCPELRKLHEVLARVADKRGDKFEESHLNLLRAEVRHALLRARCRSKSLGAGAKSPRGGELDLAASLQAIDTIEQYIVERRKSCADAVCAQANEHLREDLVRLILEVYARSPPGEPAIAKLRERLLKLLVADVSTGDLLMLLKARDIDTRAVLDLTETLEAVQSGVLFWSQQVSKSSVLEAWRAASNDPALEPMIPKEVAKALVAPRPDQAAVLEALNAAQPDDLRRLKTYTTWITQSETAAPFRGPPKGLSLSAVLYAVAPVEGAACADPTRDFRAAFERTLTSWTNGGMYRPQVVTPADLPRALESTLCRCGQEATTTCPLAMTYESGLPRCDAVLAVQLGAHDGRGRAKATVFPWARARLDQVAKPTGSLVDSGSFLADCSETAREEQLVAALRFATSLANTWALAENAPVRTIAPIVRPATPPDRRWAALVVSGLPELLDTDPANNSRGRLLAAVDGTLVASGVAALGLSVHFRNQYAEDPSSRPLDDANTALWIGFSALAATAVLRMVSGVLYRSPEK